jgi:arsenate reductase (glutaredoxin)
VPRAAEDVRPVVIFHNPGCSTSNKVLGLIRERGLEPEVVRYVERGWTRASLSRVLDARGVGPRELLRTKSAEGRALADKDEATIFAAMLADPTLVERPVVTSAKGAALCRPAERVLTLL